MDNGVAAVDDGCDSVDNEDVDGQDTDTLVAPVGAVDATADRESRLGNVILTPL